MENRIRIEGDHSHYHAGSAAAYAGLIRIAKDNGWHVVKQNQEYDVLVVNGEGTMHHGAPGFHHKMRLLADALERGKAAYLVNTVWQSNPSDYDDVLRSLSGIVAREVFSRDALLADHGISVRVIPDVSMYCRLPWISLRKNYRQRPTQTDYYLSKTNTFERAKQAFPDVKYMEFDKVTWGSAVASLKTASYLVTGRQHGVYAACRARIPFAASEGNTHKIRGLIASAGVNIPVADTPEGIRDIVPLIPTLTGEYNKLFTWLEGQDYLSCLPRYQLPA